MEFVCGAQNMRYKVRLQVILYLAVYFVRQGAGKSVQLHDTSPVVRATGAARDGSEAGSEVSQVLEPLSSDYSICVKCFLYPSGAVFTFPHFSVGFIFSLLPNMPLWGGIFVKSTQVSALGASPSSITASILAMIYSSQQTFGTQSPHQGFPHYPYTV